MEYLFYKWDSYFNKSELVKLSETIYDKRNKEFEEIGATVNGERIKKATTLAFEWIAVKHLMKRLDEAIFVTNQNKYGYNVHTLLDCDTLLYNIYDAKKNHAYAWHKDGEGDGDKVCIKFTVLINVSTEPYEGGKFQLFGNGVETEVPAMNTPGSVVMFKSDIPHRVLPITKGIRKSITIFIKGPPFV